MKICSKCFQYEHDGDCIPISHPEITVTFKANVPYSVFLTAMRDINIKIKESCYMIFDEIESPRNNDDNISELSWSSNETDEKEDVLMKFLFSIDLGKEIHFDNLSPKQTPASHIKKMILTHLKDVKHHHLKLVFQTIEKIGEVIYPKSSTRDVFYTHIRNELKKQYPIKSPEYILCLDNMKIKREERKELQTNYVEKVKERNKNQIEYKQSELLDNIKKIASSNHIVDNFILGLVISGCRPCELMTKNTFEVHSDTEVKISNLAKKRGAKNQQTCIRPIIHLSSQEFMNIVNRVRNEIENTKNFNKKVARRTEKIFNCNPSTLRKIYGNLAYQLFSNNNTNQNVFLSEILGHDPLDLQTSFSYSTLKITP